VSGGRCYRGERPVMVRRYDEREEDEQDLRGPVSCERRANNSKRRRRVGEASQHTV
jgi:hypothetical protein